uniref:LRRNT domain-containing protein n=1 Tax=Mola mola TaxID=94237 RepID=A0A3Q4BNR7_MOLML
MWRILLLLVLGCWITCTTFITQLCPHRCICYEHADLVDCRGHGFKYVPRGIPHGTWLLELGGNNLSHIGMRAFIGLWSLHKLDLSYNQLQSVGPGVFRGLSRLRQLYLHNNRLTVVQQGSLDMLGTWSLCSDL